MTQIKTLSGIYGITDDTLLPATLLLEGVEKALASGISLIQYRSKTTTAENKLKTAIQLKQLCDKYTAALIINDDIELALNSQADGVHLGRQDGDITTARNLLGAQAIIGVTCHGSLELAQQAQQQGASYVAFGRFFKSLSKPEAPGAALSLIGRARATLSIPIVAIGGINAENGAALLDAGADMLAVIHALFNNQGNSAAIESNAQDLMQLFQQAD